MSTTIDTEEYISLRVDRERCLMESAMNDVMRKEIDFLRKQNQNLKTEIEHYREAEDNRWIELATQYQAIIESLQERLDSKTREYEEEKLKRVRTELQASAGENIKQLLQQTKPQEVSVVKSQESASVSTQNLESHSDRTTVNEISSKEETSDLQDESESVEQEDSTTEGGIESSASRESSDTDREDVERVEKKPKASKAKKGQQQLQEQTKKKRLDKTKVQEFSCHVSHLERFTRDLPKFTVKYQMVIDLLKKQIKNNKRVVKISGKVCVKASLLFKDYQRENDLDLYAQCKGDKSKIKSLRTKLTRLFLDAITLMEEERENLSLPQQVFIVGPKANLLEYAEDSNQ